MSKKGARGRAARGVSLQPLVLPGEAPVSPAAVLVRFEGLRKGDATLPVINALRDEAVLCGDVVIMAWPSSLVVVVLRGEVLATDRVRLAPPGALPYMPCPVPAATPLAL